MIPISEKILHGYTFIDLFAGLGGFRLALESLGAKCVFSSEWDEPVAKVYQQNFDDFPKGDITKIDAKDIPDHDILCAGYPCQAFSISGKKKGFEDARGTLFFDVARIVKEKKPKVVFLENVKNFATHDNGRTLEVVRNTMEDLGYSFHYKVLNATDYDVPQKRERIYIICFREDIDDHAFSYPKPIPLTKHVEDFLIDDEKQVKHLYCNRKDMHLEPDIKEYTNKAARVGTVAKGRQGERIYSTKGVAITFSAYGGGVFAKTGGYLVNGKVRKLHPRECARIMGFPDSYIIAESDSQAYKQFGNSVIVPVLQRIGMQIGKVLQQQEN